MWKQLSRLGGGLSDNAVPGVQTAVPLGLAKYGTTTGVELTTGLELLLTIITLRAFSNFCVVVYSLQLVSASIAELLR